MIVSFSVPVCFALAAYGVGLNLVSDKHLDSLSMHSGSSSVNLGVKLSLPRVFTDRLYT